MSLEPLNARSGERHTHESGSISEALLCPTCDQPVSPELHRIIQGKEHARAAEIERALQARFASEMAQVEATKKAEIESARKSAAAQIEKAKREAATREAAIRQEAAKTAKAAAAAKLAEAEQKIKGLKGDQQAVIDKRLAEQREALDKAKVEAVNAERVTAHAERMKLDAKLQQLTRQLQNRTANQVGDVAELDLYKVLKSEFPSDNIYRIKKGQSGADIVHIVIENGKNVGKIIYDSKDRKRWQHSFTSTGPACREREREGRSCGPMLKCLPDWCGKSAPAGWCTGGRPPPRSRLANILRRQIVQVSTLRLADHERRNKSAQVYAFICSERCAQLWGQLVQVNDEMAAVDLAERAAHDKVWGKRSALERSLRDVHDQFVSTIATIIESGSETSP